MTRRKRIALIVAGSLAGLIVVLAVAAILVVQSQWFRQFVRDKIVSQVETATGGRTEIGSFRFDWRHLRATVTDFVIHGTEPAGQPPLFRAKSVEVDLKITSILKHSVDIAALIVDQPQANVIVFPDGRTNVPAPKIQHPSKESPVATIVDLAIGHFDLHNGTIRFADEKSAFDARGDNLRAELYYNLLSRGYSGTISLTPLVARSGKNPAVPLNVTVPLVMERDRIQVNNARITSPHSQIVVTANMDHLVSPHTAAHIQARLDLDEARRAAGNLVPVNLDTGGNLPRDLDADIAFDMDANGIRIRNARATLGQSNLEASGTTQNLKFNARLAVGQLGRMLRVSGRPEGTVQMGGIARMPAGGQYRVQGNLLARGLAITQGGTRLSGINIDSAIDADPRRIQLAGLRVSGMGGTFTGGAAVENLRQVSLTGRLAGFDLQQMAAAFTHRRLAWDGVLSGPVDVKDDLKAKGATGLVARVRLAIAPGRHGVPVSGRINADYNGKADTVQLQPSYLALPATRLDASGALGRRIDVRLVSHNLNDLLPALAMTSPNPPRQLPVTLNHGTASFTGAISGKLTAPRIAGHLAVDNFAVEGRPFNLLAADLEASPSGAAVQHGTLARGTMNTQFAASVGLRDWKPENHQPLNVSASMRNADLRDLLALAGQSSVPASGTLNANARINGTVGDPRGAVDVAVQNGTLEQEPFNVLQARAVLSAGRIDVPKAQFVAGTARIDFSGSFVHPAGSFQTGVIQAHAASNQVALAQFHTVQSREPGLAGTLAFNADATASLYQRAGQSEVLLKALNADLNARGIQMQGKHLGDFAATARTAADNLHYAVNSDFAGSTIRVNGDTRLVAGYPTRAAANISRLPIDQVLLVAGRTDIPAAGLLSANAKVSGTLQDPHAQANLTVVNGKAYDEPFNRLQTQFTYSASLIDVPAFELQAPGGRIDFNGSFAHPRGNFHDGQARLHVATDRLQLARFHTVQRLEPGLAGTVQLSADGAATLRHTSRAPGIVVSSLNGDLATSGMAINGKPAGDLTATARTRGSNLDFTLKSDFGRSDIHGNGRVVLAGDYPANAQLTFNNVTYSGLRPWLGGGARAGFDARADGDVRITGPLSDTNRMNGEFRLTTLQASTAATPGTPAPRRNITLHNDGPVVVALNSAAIRVRSAHVVGPGTDLRLTGGASIQNPQTVNLHANGSFAMDTLEAFDPDIFSSGAITLAAAVTGVLSNPVVNGQIQLHDASFNEMELPNGISHANGTIAFTGRQAVFENVTGTTGGGQITLAGSVSYGASPMTFHLTATAKDVLVEYPQGVGTHADAALTLAGTTDDSTVSGSVTVRGVSFHSHTDIANILSSSGEPQAAPQAKTGLLGGMKLEIRIDTAPGVQFETSLAKNIRADAHLRLRGTASRPGMLGRVTVSQGEIVFFGSQYTIDQGSVAFYDPNKINPIVNVDLQTTTKGIDVVLTVSGPMDHLKLTYRSDPPMQFSDLVALLATGKVPTTDPVLAAEQPAAPQQSWEQMGASTLLGQAVANPVAGRLQRLFGVSQLKIDPQITGAQNTPQARLTLEQQVTKDITFTYIQDVSSSNPQVIQMQWTIDPKWTAIAQRDINGEFGVDFFYKKRIH